MPDLSDTVAKCRMGTAKNFTLLLLLYHTQANGAGGNWFCSFGGRTCLWKNCSVCRCAGNHHHSSTWGNRDGCSLSKVAGKGKLKKIFRKYFGRKCVIVIAEKRK